MYILTCLLGSSFWLLLVTCLEMWESLYFRVIFFCCLEQFKYTHFLSDLLILLLPGYLWTIKLLLKQYFYVTYFKAFCQLLYGIDIVCVCVCVRACARGCEREKRTPLSDLLLFMSMVWDYISELRPPMGPVVHPPGDIWASRAMAE
jgi:hypothetical protein